MVANKKPTGRALSMPAGIAVGVLTASIVSAAGAAVLAYLIIHETAGENSIGYGSMVILFAAVLLGALIAAGQIKRHRMQVCLLTGLTYYLVLLGFNALFFEGQYEGMLVTALVVGVAAAAAGFAGVSGGKRSKFRIKKKASR